MKLRLLLAALAVSAVAAAAPTQAQEESAAKDSIKGAYFSVGVGGNWASSPSFSSSHSGINRGLPFTGSTTGTVGTGGGVAVEAGGGYDFGNNMRAELTYVYNNIAATTSSFSGNARALGLNIPYNGTYSPSGSLSTNSVFASGYYDIPTKSRFRPYFGGGLGWTNVNVPELPMTVSGTLAGTPFTQNLTAAGGSASALGYQAKVGVSYLASKTTDVFLEGTYQGNTSVTIGNASIGALNDFGVRAGLRYRFGK